MKRKGFPIAGLSYELTLDENGNLHIPFGDYLYNDKWWNRFDEVAAQQMIETFEGMRNRDKLPFYEGHPDMKDFVWMFKDHRARGYVKGICCQNEDVVLDMEWTKLGQSAIDNREFLYWSPYYFVVKTAEKKDGLPVCTPVYLKSAGFTHDPGMPLPIACQEETFFEEETQTKETGMTLTERLLKRLGFGKEADELDLENKVIELQASACQAEEQIQNANTRAEQAETQLAELQDTHAVVCQSLKKVYGEKGKQLLEVACQDGRVLPKDEDDWLAKFATMDAEAFGVACQELDELKPTVKTKTKTANVGGRAHDDKPFLEVVCQRQSELEAAGKEPCAAYEQAWAECEKAFPEKLNQGE